jgi:hypothetical protein
MTSGSFRSVSRPRDRRKSQSARLRVLASQSEAALERSETFLRNQDPIRTSARWRINSSHLDSERFRSRPTTGCAFHWQAGRAANRLPVRFACCYHAGGGTVGGRNPVFDLRRRDVIALLGGAGLLLATKARRAGAQQPAMPSKCFPLFLHERTLAGAVGTAEMCHNRP